MSAPTRSTTQRDAGSEPAYTVFSAYSGKVYACWVSAELAIGWMQPYGGSSRSCSPSRSATRGARTPTRAGSR